MLKDEEKAHRFKLKKDKFVHKVKDESQAWKQEFGILRGKKRSEMEEKLMTDAWNKFVESKAHPSKAHGKISDFDNARHDVAVKPKKPAQDDGKPTTGFMVLGMHRSGTSMLSGLLVEGFGYNPGAPLIQPAFDNEKGFFELIPAVLQNDEFMYDQKVNWAANVGKYDANLAIENTRAGKINTEKLDKAIKVLNDPENSPWLQKDPRMCITMRTWLPFLNSKPAVIFTYRNPLEVAMSLHKREQGFTLTRGMRLWIMYNKAAVKNSADLCRVLSSNNDVLSDPMKELKRISDELTSKCGVPQPPQQITKEIVDSFVDPNLQHNKKQLEATKAQKNVIESHGDCKIREFDSELPENDPRRKDELDMYLKAMRVYCDFQSGVAYDANYEWPL